MRLRLILSLAGLLFFSSCSANESVEPDHPVLGCWIKSAGSEKYLFSLSQNKKGVVSGILRTVRGGQFVDSLALTDIEISGNTLSMCTNPQSEIYFKGQLDSTKQGLKGSLFFKDGKTVSFPLQRYHGKLCVNQESVQPEFQRYRSLKELPELKSGNMPELASDFQKPESKSNQPSDADAIACVLRRHGEIYCDYPLRSSALALAFILDRQTKQMADAWQKTFAPEMNFKDRNSAIHKWTTTHLSYTQANPRFTSLPGRDPWGTFPGSPQPVFKKLIPEEMAALGKDDGKLSGKCFTLVNLISAGFHHLGVAFRDFLIVVADTPQGRHAMALVKYENQIVLVNLMLVGPINTIIQKDFKPYHLIGIYNSEFARAIDVQLGQSDIQAILELSREQPLADAFISYFQLPKVRSVLPEGFPNEPEKIADWYKTQGNQHQLAILIEYCQQRIGVPNPGIYIQAARQSGLVDELSGKLRSPQQILDWIAGHIRFGSIFDHPEQHWMMPDQVLVFQQGTFKDQALLALVLLEKIQIHPQLHISDSDALLSLRGSIYSFHQRQFIPELPGDILLSFANTKAGERK